jgi:predicted ATPase
MGQRFIEDIGLITYDDKLSEEEIQANIDYRRAITPKYEKQTFATGFNDTQSMIYRWWQKLSDEENEEGRWLEDNTKNWAQNIGYYDSIALEAYYAEIANARQLNGLKRICQMLITIEMVI